MSSRSIVVSAAQLALPRGERVDVVIDPGILDVVPAAILVDRAVVRTR
jgi:hypothetical protein